MHTVSTTPILGLQVFHPYIFSDYRGTYVETYNQQDILPDVTFVQDSAITSRKGVLRGFHGDARTTKLITCLRGSFSITFLCIDPTNEKYLQHETIILDDKERLSVVLPPKFVNAHQCLTDECVFFYKQNTFYKGERYQYTIKWDSVPGVTWSLPPVLSMRDEFTINDASHYVLLNHLYAPEEVNI